MSYIQDTIEYKGYTIEIISDENAENPRAAWDNVGTMVCWHNRYDLGDSESWKGIDGKMKYQNLSKNYNEPIDLLYELAGLDREEAKKANYYKQILKKFKDSKYYERDQRDKYNNGKDLICDNEYLKIIEEVETGTNHSDWEKDNWQYQIGNYLSKEKYYIECNEDDMDYADLYKAIDEKGTVILPLYLYDHSGITMSTSSFSCGWDSGQVGWIYITKQQIEAEGWTTEQAKKYLEGEVETYDNYLTGNVYGYKVIKEDEDGDEEDLDSCWGYYGDPEKSGCIEEAKNTVDYYCKKAQEEYEKQPKKKSAEMYTI